MQGLMQQLNNLTRKKKMNNPTGIDIIEGICAIYNQEINTGGKIQTNNANIWQVLHACDDEIWSSIFDEVLEDPRYSSCHWKTAQLRQHLRKYGPVYGPFTITPYEGAVKRERRPKEHTCRGKLWNWIFDMRDAYNTYHHIHLPNLDSSKGLLDPKPFDTLFEVNQ